MYNVHECTLYSTVSPCQRKDLIEEWKCILVSRGYSELEPSKMIRGQLIFRVSIVSLPFYLQFDLHLFSFFSFSFSLPISLLPFSLVKAQHYFLQRFPFFTLFSNSLYFKKELSFYYPETIFKNCSKRLDRNLKRCMFLLKNINHNNNNCSIVSFSLDKTMVVSLTMIGFVIYLTYVLMGCS